MNFEDGYHLPLGDKYPGEYGPPVRVCNQMFLTPVIALDEDGLERARDTVCTTEYGEGSGEGWFVSVCRQQVSLKFSNAG